MNITQSCQRHYFWSCCLILGHICVYFICISSFQLSSELTKLSFFWLLKLLRVIHQITLSIKSVQNRAWISSFSNKWSLKGDAVLFFVILFSMRTGVLCKCSLKCLQMQMFTLSFSRNLCKNGIGLLGLLMLRS